MIHLLEIHPERNRKHRLLPKPHMNRMWLGMVMAKIRIADASLSLHCSLAAAAAARPGRSSLLTAQNVSFEP